MNCTDFATTLDTLRDTDRPASRADLDSHARACAACSKLLAAEERLQAALQDLRVSSRAAAVHSPAFDARVKRAVRQAGRHAAGPRWLAWPVLTSALASAIAVGAIVTVSLRETKPTSVAAVTADAAPIKTPAPVLFSDGRVEVVSRPAPSRSAPTQAPVQNPIATLVLVEWDL